MIGKLILENEIKKLKIFIDDFCVHMKNLIM